MSVLEHLWDNSELYQLIKGYPGGIIIFGLRGEILEVNPVVEELLGCSESTLYEKKYADLCAPEYTAAEATILKTQAFVSGFTALYEKKYQLEGKSVLVFQHAYLLKDGSGQPLCMLVMLSPVLPNDDRSTTNRSLMQLEKENEKLKSALADSNQAALEQARADLATLQNALEKSRENLATLAQSIVVKDKTIQWKNAEIEKLAAEITTLRHELHETKGALEVALIMSSSQDETPTVESRETGTPLKDEPPLPTDTYPFESEETQADIDDAHPVDDAPTPPDGVLPWEADDVVYDKDVVKIVPIAVVGKKTDSQQS